MRYEDLTGAHLREWGRDVDHLTDADLEYEAGRRFGYALRGDDGQLKAIGGVKWLDGREEQDRPGVHLIAWFEGRDRSIWVHRMAIYLLSALAAAGERVVWAIPDPTIPGAERWMERLGFSPRGDGVWQRGVATTGGESSLSRIDAVERVGRTDAGQF